MANLDDGGKLPMAFQQSLFEALLKNNKMQGYWSEREKVYQELDKNLAFYVNKLKHEIYAPVGKKAFMKGTIVHTNDITVAIGCGYFLKVSSSGAQEICQRRLKEINQVMTKLKQEKLFIENKINLPTELFENSVRREIIEPYDEVEEEKWREKHQDKIREHKKELAIIREQILLNKLNTEDDHMKHLDLLEMQEELEEEIDRLGGESESEESQDISEGEDIEDDIQVEELKEEKPIKIEKKVRFDPEDSIKEISSDEPVAIADDVKETIPKQTENFKRPISKFKASRLKN